MVINANTYVCMYQQLCFIIQSFTNTAIAIRSNVFYIKIMTDVSTKCYKILYFITFILFDNEL